MPCEVCGVVEPAVVVEHPGRVALGGDPGERRPGGPRRAVADLVREPDRAPDGDLREVLVGGPLARVAHQQVGEPGGDQRHRGEGHGQIEADAERSASRQTLAARARHERGLRQPAEQEFQAKRERFQRQRLGDVDLQAPAGVQHELAGAAGAPGVEPLGELGELVRAIGVERRARARRRQRRRGRAPRRRAGRGPGRASRSAPGARRGAPRPRPRAPGGGPRPGCGRRPPPRPRRRASGPPRSDARRPPRPPRRSPPTARRPDRPRERLAPAARRRRAARGRRRPAGSARARGRRRRAARRRCARRRPGARPAAPRRPRCRACRSARLDSATGRCPGAPRARR